MRSLAVANRPLDSQKRSEEYPIMVKLAATEQTHVCGNDFPGELCAQNSGDMSLIIKVVTIEQAYML